MTTSSKIRRVGIGPPLSLEAVPSAPTAQEAPRADGIRGACTQHIAPEQATLGNMPSGATRDPLSEWFDAAARKLIRRAYNRRGQWVGVYLAPPTITQRAYAARLGIYDLYERDRWGEQRWVRAYKRAVYYNLKKHGFSDAPRWDQFRVSAWPAVALEWQTGQRVTRANWPGRRWAIRVRLHDGGSAARRAAEAKPASKQWIGTPRQSTIDDRDW